METEILIIGAGASGGVAAKYFAENGLKVLCLEQGEWPDDSKFVGRRDEGEFLAEQRWAGDPNIRLQEADYPVDVSESDIDVMMYNAVGGSTVLWTALWHRMLPSDFRVKSLDGVAADWPISYADLEPFYDEVEADMGVSGLAGDPAHPTRKPYPLPPLPIGKLGMKFAEGLNKLGWHWWPGTNAIPSRDYRGRNACVRRGVCMTGCADGAKATMNLTHWPAAVAAGATLITGARVSEITVDDAGLATGAIYIDRAGTQHKVKAQVVICCANGIGTPRLLMLSRSGKYPQGLANSSGLVGRGLMLHPCTLVSGVFADSLDTWVGPMGQLVNSMQFYESQPSRGFVRGSKWSLVPGGGPLALAMALPGHGADFHAGMKYMFGHTASVLAFAEDLPEDHNRVVLDDVLTDSDELPAAKICYRVSGNTRKLLDFNMARIGEALTAAGATQVFSAPLRRDFGGAHLMGTTCMGLDPSTSVVNEWGRSHDVPNLYVFDGSVFVTASAVNPTATITALALRFAKKLVQERRMQKVPT